MLIMQIEPQESGQHSLQSQSGRTECWLEGWVEVPAELESKVWGCLGYCGLVMEGEALVDVTPGEVPAAVQVAAAPTTLERIEAQVTYTAMMTDTLLEEE